MPTPIVKRHSTTMSYDNFSGVGQIVTQFDNGYHVEQRIPMPEERMGYYRNVSMQVAAEVVKHGLLPDNGNLQGQNASTATLMALMMARGEGIDVDTALKDPATFTTLVNTSLENQMLEHYTLAEKLKDALRGTEKSVTAPLVAAPTAATEKPSWTQRTIPVAKAAADLIPL